MTCNTQKGLKFFLIGLGFGIILNIALFLLSFFPSDNFVGSIGFLLVIAIVGLIMALIMLIGAVFFLLGKNEFGERHSKNITYAVIIFIIPRYRFADEWLKINCENQINKFGFKTVGLSDESDSLLYWRNSQHIGREIWKFEKQ